MEDEIVCFASTVVYKSKRTAPGMLEMYVMLNLRSSSHLSEHGFLSEVPKLQRPVKYLEWFQGRAMKVIKDLKANTFEGRLKEQELFLL